MSEPAISEPLPDRFAADDVAAIVRLLGAAVTGGGTLAAKRRAILEGLARLVDADVWIWIRNRTAPGEHLPAPLELLDGGYVDEAERGRFLGGLVDAEISAVANPRMMAADAHRTLLMDEIMPTEFAGVRARWQRLAGMGECVVSVYPVGPRNFSGIGFHRRLGRPAFTPRERGLVHVVAGQLDFLHRDGLDVPANADALLSLSPRERQVLIYLLGGDPAKLIGPKINLSVHTVNDHIRSIYRRLNVRSRAHLMRLFLTGGAARPPTAADAALARLSSTDGRAGARDR